MGFFGAKSIRCKSNQLTTIISQFGRGYDQDIHVTISSDDGTAISGTYVEKRYLWIFPQPPVCGPVSSQMTFRRRWINGIYIVKVQLDCECTVSIR